MPRQRQRTVTIGEDVVDDDDESHLSFETHPLFPLDKNNPRQKGFEVSYIQITRHEEGVQKWGPCIRADEIKSENDITERYGGGQYVLIAREATKTGSPGDITKHQRLNLPGIPKPLSADPTPQELKLSSPHAHQSQNGGTVVSPVGSDPMAMMTMMMTMNQQALERERQSSEKFMQMFLALTQGSKSDSQNMMQMVMQMNQSQQQGMLQFITAMMGSRGGGPEEFAKYAELIRALSPGEKKDPAKEGDGQSISAMLENAADLVQGIVQLKGSMTPGPTIPPSHEQPALPPGTGGAASLLRGLR